MQVKELFICLLYTLYRAYKQKQKRRYLAFPNILNTLVPQVGHSPFMALMPFFIVISLPSLISTCFLHFMHLPLVILLTSEFVLI